MTFFGQPGPKTFKKNPAGPDLGGAPARWTIGLGVWLALGSALTWGCRTPGPWPAANLADEGWQVRRGQAAWEPSGAAPAVTGDLMVAHHTSGEAYLRFSKEPLTLVLARCTSNAWRLEIPARGQEYAGAGTPPGRVVWFRLLQAAQGDSVPAPWRWEAADPARWLLRNRRTGECVEGVFLP